MNTRAINAKRFSKLEDLFLKEIKIRHALSVERENLKDYWPHRFSLASLRVDYRNLTGIDPWHKPFIYAKNPTAKSE